MQEALEHPYTLAERAFVQDRLDAQVSGGPETVRAGLTDLLRATGADELMVTTMTHDPADRLRSYRLLADVWQQVHATAA